MLTKLGLNINSTNKSIKMLVNHQEVKDKSNKWRVQEVNCSACGAIYFDQTGCNYSSRMKEGNNYMADGKRVIGFTGHSMDNKHFFNGDYFKILHCSKNGNQKNFRNFLNTKVNSKKQTGNK